MDSLIDYIIGAITRIFDFTIENWHDDTDLRIAFSVSCVCVLGIIIYLLLSTASRAIIAFMNSFKG